MIEDKLEKIDKTYSYCEYDDKNSREHDMVIAAKLFMIVLYVLRDGSFHFENKEMVGKL